MTDIKCLRCGTAFYVHKKTSVCLECIIDDIQNRLERLEQQ